MILLHFEINIMNSICLGEGQVVVIDEKGNGEVVVALRVVINKQTRGEMALYGKIAGPDNVLSCTAQFQMDDSTQEWPKTQFTRNSWSRIRIKSLT